MKKEQNLTSKGTKNIYMNQGILVAMYFSVLNEKLIKLSNIQTYCCSGPFEISVAADLLCILHNKRSVMMLSPTSLPKGFIDDQ